MKQRVTIKPFFTLLLLFVLGLNLRAQLITNSGKEFWFAFPETYDKTAAVYWVNITSNFNTSGTVSIPGQAWSQNFTIASGAVAKVYIPSNFATNIGSDMLFNTAIKITSNDDVVAFAVTYHQFRHEAAMILPNEAIGDRYRAITYQSETKSGLQESEFCIIATGDTAVVDITPSANVAGGKNANSTYSVTIPPNQVYQAQALSDADDLTGSLIKSTNGEKISVYAGNVWSTIVCSPNSDPILEGMFPTNTWGKDYFVVPTPSVGLDYIRILADKDSTKIFRDGVLRQTLQEGEFYEDTITAIHQYTSNNPIAAAHFLVTGQGGCTQYTNTDPSMIILNATEQMYLDSISFFAVDTSAIDSHFVHILTRTSDTNKMYLNAAQMTNWTPFTQNSNYCYKTERVQPGSHRLETTGCGFIAYSMGIGNAVSYGYATGASLIDLEKEISYTNFSGSDTICQGDTVQFKSLLRGKVVQYQWYFGDGDSSNERNPTHSYENAGTYYVTAYVVYECVPYDTILDTLVIPEFTSNYTLSTNDISCYNSQDGWISAGGTFIKSVVWDPTISNISQDSAFSLAAGNYEISLVDSAGCIRDTIIEITEPPLLILDSIQVDSNLCYGDTSGSIAVFASGGSPGYSYLWNANNQTTSQISGLLSNNYSVTVTDTNNCTTDSLITVLQPDTMMLNSNQINALCFGDSTGSISVNVSGGSSPYTYQWYKWGGGVASINLNQLNADTFRIKVTDSKGCIKDSLFTILEPTLLSVDTVYLTHVNCFGDSTGQAVALGQGGVGNYTFNWDASINQTNVDTALSLTQGSYSITITDTNNCIASDTFSITQSPQLLPHIDGTNLNCFGDSTGKAWAWATGGIAPYSYLWDVNAKNQTSDTATILSANTFQVQITDFLGCTVDTQIVISQPTALSISSFSPDSVLCYGDTTGQATIVAIGGTPGYSYLWDSSANGQTSSLATGLAEGSYRVTISDTNNCSIDTLIEIFEPDTITLNYTQINALCFGDSSGSVTLNVSGGTSPYSYSWNKWGGNVNSTQLTQLNADTFRVTISDNNSCFKDSLFTILQPTELNIDTIIVGAIDCFGDSTGFAHIKPSGGVGAYTYTWSSNVLYSNNDSALQLFQATYWVKVSDTNACTAIDTFGVNESPKLIPSISGSEVDCYGDSTGKSWAWATGGNTPYSFLWSTNANQQTTDTAFTLKGETYKVQITDLLGCIADTSILIGEPPILIIDSFLIDSVYCYGDTTGLAKVYVSGGKPGYSYLWDVNAKNQTSDLAIGLTSGSFRMTITDVNNCTVDSMISVYEPDTISLNYTQINALCYGDSTGGISLNISGGSPPYNYLWNKWGGMVSTSNLTQLNADTFRIQITDNKGCAKDSLFTILEPTELVVDTILLTQINCFGQSTGKAIAKALGGVGNYSFAWSSNIFVSNSDTALQLKRGFYGVSITDTNNCFVSDTFSILQSAQIVPQINGSEVRCFGENNGQAWAWAIGGKTPYSYQWDASANSQVTDTAFSLSFGTYQVQITDSLGCTANTQIFINQPDSLSSTINKVNARCYDSPDGSATIIVTGGRKPFTYQWNSSSTGQGTDSLFAIKAGKYSCTVTDSSGCLIIDTVSILEPQPLLLSLTNTNKDTICVGDVITINTNVNGGKTPYKFIWNNGSVGNSLTDNPTANTEYSVSVTDSNNCPFVADSIMIFVMDLKSDVFSINNNGPICIGDSIIITSNHSGTYPPYTYTYNPQVFTGIGQFTYAFTDSTEVVLTIEDQCGVTVSDSTFVVVNPLPELNVPSEAFEGCEDLFIQVKNNVSNASSYTYSWNFGDGSTSDSVNVDHTYTNPGSYEITVIVTSPQGCKTSNNGNLPISVWPLPIPDIGTNKTTAKVGSANFELQDFSSGASSIDWFYLDTNRGSASIYEITFTDTGTYRIKLVAISEYGCVDSAFQYLEVTPSHIIRTPNAFMPNKGGPNSGSGSGSNGGNYDPDNPSDQVFFPYVEHAEEYHLMIYNRWGELVFQSFDINQGWDGYYKGKISAQDVYLWKLNVTFTDGVQKELIGDLTLLH